MTSTPHYQITSCCDFGTTQGLFIIPAMGIVADGVYIYNGVTFVEPTTGMSFVSGTCYTVEYFGNTGALFPAAFNEADITLSAANDCASSDCGPCSLLPDGIVTYSIFNCCDSTNIITLNIDITSCAVSNGTWLFNGPDFSTPSGFNFVTDVCYNFTRQEEGLFDFGPPCTNFTISDNDCKEAQETSLCKPCVESLPYLRFRSCCDKQQFLFKGGLDAFAYFGVREFLETPIVDGLQNICYSIIVGYVGDLYIPTISDYNALPDPPAYIEGVTFATISSTSTNCLSFIESCPTCNPQCYTLYNCDGNSFNTTANLALYIGSFIKISNVDGQIPGSWFVVENNGECTNAVTGIIVDSVEEPCDVICYDVTGTGEATYISTDLTLVTSLVPDKFCAYTYPIVSSTATVNSYGDCKLVNRVYECPQFCFLLTNCLDDTLTYNSNTQSLLSHVGQVVTINGYDGCWEVSINEGICDCPINATVLTSHATCEDCLPIVAYKFTNCTNPLQVQYTYNDFSAYVGHGVELECGQCWLVEQIDYAPPSVQVITVAFDFESCAACARTYYLLQDCSGILPDIYTFTDLSNQVNLIIKLKDCDTCWRVLETRELQSPATIVSFEIEYIDCTTCQTDVPCLCSTIRNDQIFTASFEYVDCFGERVSTQSILPGETSDRICLQRWLYDVDQTNYVTYYGECIDNECPPPVYKVRTVKPGYNTPGCSVEKYERITCKASQILYRNVLTLRYGISNCCPEEDQDWLVKKELIDLAALYDPNYPCTIQSCGCGSTSGCSCNSGCSCGQPDDCSCNQLRSCNS
jgi:hypothetical protein